MPWKGINDPYKIWLSEIILQQTRVNQGISYYEKFIKNYPNINHLANASETELLRDWQGLGYYNRCRNLHETAKNVSKNYQGNFPNEYIKIRNLKGIGDYTAAAIASFAFKLPYAVVDGNVVRVLSRLFCIGDNFYTSAGKRKFQELAQEVLDVRKPDLFNQAMMDLGATICLPQSPKCTECPLVTICKAHATETINNFPLKKAKLIIKPRFFHFLAIQDARHFYLIQRNASDIWKGLYTFYMLEKETPIKLSDIFEWELKEKLPKPILLQQLLTHQKIEAKFYDIRLDKSPKKLPQGVIKVLKKDIKQIGFPRIMISFFEKFNYL